MRMDRESRVEGEEREEREGEEREERETHQHFDKDTHTLHMRIGHMCIHFLTNNSRLYSSLSLMLHVSSLRRCQTLNVTLCIFL